MKKIKVLLALLLLSYSVFSQITYNQLDSSTIQKKLKPYKVWSAILNQVGQDDPTAIVLENTIGEITLDRIQNGLYRIKSDNLFAQDKSIAITMTSNFIAEDMTGLYYVRVKWIDTNYFFLSTGVVDVNYDDYLINHYVEIRVYD